MSRPSMPLGAATGEPLYDVFNKRGLALLLVVPTVRRAKPSSSAGNKEIDSGPATCIAMSKRGQEVLEMRASIVRVSGRLEVWCDGDRLLLSGLGAAELFSAVRPHRSAPAASGECDFSQCLF